MSTSAVIIARLLGCEGITDHLANEITRYAQSRLPAEELVRAQRMKHDFSNAVDGLATEEKMAIGRFVNVHKQWSLDAGLRLGLMAAAVTRSIDVDDGRDQFNAALYGPAKPRDDSYSIEVSTPAGYLPLEGGEAIADRSHAKLFARDAALRLGTKTRVKQSGHIVQRYDAQGHKCGGD